MKLSYVIHDLEVGEYHHFEKPCAIFVEVFLSLSSETRGGEGGGVPAQIKTGNAILSRNYTCIIVVSDVRKTLTRHATLHL